MKAGDLVVICDPGSPYNNWNGASCVVVNPRAGHLNRYVTVRPVLELGGVEGTHLFHPDDIKLETRPWLKKHLKQLFKMRMDLLRTAEKIVVQYRGVE